MLIWLNEHGFRPIALVLHRLLHHHAADDDCIRCLDETR